MAIEVFSFFSGLGFMDLGFEEAGFDIAFVNEYNHSFTFIRQISEDCIRQSCHHSRRGFMQSYTG